MEEQNDFMMDTLSLLDEDGVEHEFEVADAMELDGREYMALIPLYDQPEDSLEDAGELVILRVSDELDADGEPFLDDIQDDEEYERVAQAFMSRLGDSYDFEPVEEDQES